MKNAVIVHGKLSKERYFDPDFPSSSNYYWLPWLQNQLIIQGVHAQTPEMPNGWAPSYDDWRQEIERYDISADTLLVGHSCGAGFLLRWLSNRTDVNVNKIILVAPWIDPANKESMGDFFDFALDPELAQRADDFCVVYSNDEQSVLDTVDIIRGGVPGTRFVQVANRRHFYDDETSEFPELLTELQR